MPTDWLTELRRVNLNQLVAFAAIAEKQSFRGAAIDLHISQSALSVQLQQLELNLGVTLLHRDTRTVKVTEEGARLEQIVRRSGTELARIFSQLKAEGRLQRGEITLAALPSLAAMYLPQMMRQFQRSFPSIRIKMNDMDSAQAYQKIREGGFDIAVVSQPPEGDEFRFQPLFKEDLVGIVPASDPLFQSSSTITATSLSQRPWLLNPKGVALRDDLELIFQDEELDIEPTQELTGSASLVALVALGMGVTILPKSSLHGKDLSACRILPLLPARTRKIGVILPPGRTPSPATKAFRDFLLNNTDATATSAPASTSTSTND